MTIYDNYTFHFIDKNGKTRNLKSLQDYVFCKGTEEYKNKVKNFANKFINFRNFDRVLSNDISKFDKTIMQISLGDSFLPFYQFFISDVFKYIEIESGDLLLKYEKDYRKLLDHHNNLYHIMDYYTQIEMVDFTKQQADKTKNDKEMFKNYYEPYLKKCIKLIKKDKGD